jgi:H+-transporting ATPase
MVIIMITGDFLGMSVTADNVRPSAKPNQWQIGKLVWHARFWGSAFSGSALSALLVGKYQLGLDIGALQTLAAIALVFGGEATLYAYSRTPTFVELSPRHMAHCLDHRRHRDHLRSGDARHRDAASANCSGRFYASGISVFCILLDLIKVPVFRRFQIA